jgi:aspartyl protease
MKRSSRSWIGLALLVSLAAPASLPARVAPLAAAIGERDEEVAKLLARARAACGVESFRAQAKGRELLLQGTSKRYGVEGPWSLRLAADGRYLRLIGGDLHERDGFDGREAWRADSNGVAIVASLETRERLALEIGLLFGGWCVEGGPILVLGAKAPKADPAAAAESDVTTLRLRARDGVLEVELEVDRKSALPKALRWSAAGETENWSFSSWRTVGGELGAGGLAVPGTFEIDASGTRLRFDLEEGKLAATEADGAFSRPKTRPDDTTFDASVPSRLAGRRARSGHLVVKAKLAGQELGGFIFDSGAGTSALAPRVVDALSLERFGETQVGGGGAGRVVSHFVRGAPLTIGPATVTGLRFNEFDLTGLEQSLGEKLAGIVGYDLLQRVVAVVSMKAGTVDLFDPKSFARDDASWSPLILHGNHAHVRATFEHDGEEEGIFRLDTGAPNVTILFHSPAVRTLGLLDPNAPPFRGLSGIGGEMRAHTGRLDGLTIGGRTFDRPSVILCEDESGALADPWSTGTMGGGILESFDVIFDYPHEHIGFVEHAPGR